MNAIVDKKDLLTKNLVGKKIGNVVLISIRQVLENYDISTELKKMQKGIPELQSEKARHVLKNTNYKKMLSESKMLCRIKIIEYVKKINDKKHFLIGIVVILVIFANDIWTKKEWHFQKLMHSQ